MKRLITFSGPSGSGKTSLIRLLRERYPDAVMITNTTTRPPRPSDLPDEYEYVNTDTFAAREAAGEFLWVFTHTDTRYGTERKRLGVLDAPARFGLMHGSPEVMRRLRVILGARREWNGMGLHFFLNPPTSPEAWRARLLARGESEEFIEHRFREETRWVEEAHALDVPFCFVPGDLSLSEAFGFVLARIEA